MAERPTFEVALTLAGAISAGAYTAGVLDFLVEALDAWHEDSACAHRVVLHNLSGASAGSICAAILGALIRYRFPHVRIPGPELPRPGSGADNALFDAWVNRIDIKDLLEHRDLDVDPTVMSALDATKLVEIAKVALQSGGERVVRTFVAEPLRIRLVLTNLRGVPYRISMSGTTGEAHMMRMHADHVRFALTGAGGFPVDPSRPIGDWRHERVMPFPRDGDDDKFRAWRAFADAALASAAFPAGLRPRTVYKDQCDYRNLPIVIPGGPGKDPFEFLSNPDWHDGPGTDYGFAVSDGGSMSNEPIELARQALVRDDPSRRNPRNGEIASRAVLLIDPFVGAIPEGPAKDTDAPLLKILFQLLGAYKNDARYNPADLALASLDGVYSRFLIAPDRGDDDLTSDGRAIASGVLGGFGGFLAWEFRAHDYFLGRRNCQRFLDAYLGLPEGNPLFAEWPDTLRARYRFDRAGAKGKLESHLPIIPLCGALRPKDGGRIEPLPNWPVGKCDLEDLMVRLEDRIDHLYDKLADEVRWFQSLALWIGWKVFGKPKLLEAARGRVESSLREHRLLKE